MARAARGGPRASRRRAGYDTGAACAGSLAVVAAYRIFALTTRSRPLCTRPPAAPSTPDKRLPGLGRIVWRRLRFCERAAQLLRKLSAHVLHLAFRDALRHHRADG